jgi:hypothetical protein
LTSKEKWVNADKLLSKIYENTLEAITYKAFIEQTFNSDSAEILENTPAIHTYSIILRASFEAMVMALMRIWDNANGSDCQPPRLLSQGTANLIEPLG